MNTTPKPRTYGSCPDCHAERKAVVEKVDGLWRYRLACDCNPPQESTKEDA